MAVQRSLVVENTRKSIGQITYYRVRGVQLARSKPTFAPGRTFTEPQKVQQAKMKIVQYIMQELNVKSWAPYCNCAVIKRYNAASKINRMTARMLDEVPQTSAEAIASMPEEVGNEAEDFLGQIMYTFSTGNIYVPVITEATYTPNQNEMGINLTFDESSFARWINDVNRILRWKIKPTIYNVGICGIFSKNISSGSYYLCPVQLMNEEDYAEDNMWSGSFRWQGANSVTNTLYASLCLFVAAYTGDVTHILASEARVCTSTFRQQFTLLS